MKTLRMVGLGCALAALFAACIKPPTSTDETDPTVLSASGELRLEAEFDKAIAAAALKTSPQDVARVEVAITWEGGATPTMNMVKDSTYHYSLAVFDLPTGIPLAISLIARASNDQVLYVGGVEAITLTAGQPSNLAVNLSPFDDGANAGAPPKIVAVRRPETSVQTGQVVGLEFVVSDAGDGVLTFETQSERDGACLPATGTVNLSGQTTLALQYRAPTTPGPVQITFSVADVTGLRAQYAFALNIVPIVDATNPGAAGLVVNFPPAILDVTTQRAAGTNTLQLLAHVSDDAEALTFDWSVGGTTFSTENPAAYPPNTGTVTVTLTVTDPDHASTTVLFQLDTGATQLGNLPITNRAPTIAAAYASSLTAAYGVPVTLTVHARDLDGGALTPTWTTDRGTVGSFKTTVQGEETICQAAWMPAATIGTGHISVTVRDPSQAATTFVFTIEQTVGKVGLTGNAGPDRVGYLGQLGQLDGSASASDDGTILTYRWTQVSGPASSLATPAAVSTTVTFTTVGTYVFRLTITNVNNTATDDVTFTVTDPMAFEFSQAEQDDAGVVYFLDKPNKQVRRYSIPQQTWLQPLTLGLDEVKCLAVLPDASSIFVGTISGRIDRVNPATGARTTFATTAGAVMAMVKAGDYLFVVDASGSSYGSSFSLFRLSDGLRTANLAGASYSYSAVYSPINKTVYTFRDNTSPNDIYRTLIDPNTGSIGATIESPYHGDYGFAAPVRLFPNESAVLVSGGQYFDPVALTYKGTIGTAYKDLRFIGTRCCLIRQVGSYSSYTTELMIMNGSDFSLQSNQFFGYPPLRMLSYGNRVMVVMNKGTNLIDIGFATLP